MVAEAEALARTIAAKPWLPVATTTRQVRAISRSMVGMDRTWADGDLLALAMGDLANGNRSSGEASGPPPGRGPARGARDPLPPW